MRAPFVKNLGPTKCQFWNSGCITASFLTVQRNGTFLLCHPIKENRLELTVISLATIHAISLDQFCWMFVLIPRHCCQVIFSWHWSPLIQFRAACQSQAVLPWSSPRIYTPQSPVLPCPSPGFYMSHSPCPSQTLHCHKRPTVHYKTAAAVADH